MMYSKSWNGPAAVIGGLVLWSVPRHGTAAAADSRFHGRASHRRGRARSIRGDRRPDRAVGEGVTAILLRRHIEIDRNRQVGHSASSPTCLSKLAKKKPRRGRSFDPERSVIVVVALENQQVTVTPGTVSQRSVRLAPQAGRTRSDFRFCPPGERKSYHRGDLVTPGCDQQLDRGAGQRNALCRGSSPGLEVARRRRTSREHHAPLILRRASVPEPRGARSPTSCYRSPRR